MQQNDTIATMPLDDFNWSIYLQHRIAQLVARAEQLGADYVAADNNLSTGPKVITLLRIQRELLDDADAEGVPRGYLQDITEKIVDAALA